MSWKQKLFARAVHLALALAVFASFSGAHGTHVAACGELSVSNTLYHLTQGVSSTGTCFNLNADLVTLDCGDGERQYEIVFANSNGAGQRKGAAGVSISASNAVVRNCKITEGPDPNGNGEGSAGIRISPPASGVTLLNNSISVTSPATRSAAPAQEAAGGIALDGRVARLYALNNTVFSASSPPLNASCSNCRFWENRFDAAGGPGSPSIVSDLLAVATNNSFRTGLELRKSAGAFFNNSVLSAGSAPALFIAEPDAAFTLLVFNNSLAANSNFSVFIAGPVGVGRISFWSNALSSNKGAFSLGESSSALFRNDSFAACGAACLASFESASLSGNSHARFSNISLDYSKLAFGSGANNATVSWLLDALVTNGGVPVPGATVRIANATSLTPMLSLATGSNGAIQTVELAEFAGNNSLRKQYSPYSVEAFSPDANAFEETLLSSSKSLNLRLGLTRCGTITQNLVLDRDVSALRTCFNVQASNVIVDCRGHLVEYAKAGYEAESFLDGVNNGFYSKGFSNVTVKDCSFLQNAPASTGATAIVFVDTLRASALNNSVVVRAFNSGHSPLANSHGIVVSGFSPNSLVFNNSVETRSSNSHGVVLHRGASGVSVANNSITTYGVGSAGIALDSSSNSLISQNNIASLGDVSPAIFVSGSGERNLLDANNIGVAGQGSDGILLRGVSPLRTLYPASSWSSSGMTFFNSSRVNDGVGCEAEESPGLRCQNALHVDESGVGAWMRLDSGAGSEKEFLRVRIQSRAVYSAVWDVQFSDNGVDWSVAYSDWNSGAAADSAVDLPRSGRHRFWRLYKKNSASPGSWMAELQFYESVLPAAQLKFNVVRVVGPYSRGITSFVSSGVSAEANSVAVESFSTTGLSVSRSSKIAVNNSVFASSPPSVDSVAFSAGEFYAGAPAPVSGLSLEGNSFVSTRPAEIFSHASSFSNNFFIAEGFPSPIGVQLNHSSNNYFRGGKLQSSNKNALWLYNSKDNFFEATRFSGNASVMQGSTRNEFHDLLNASKETFVFQGAGESVELYWSARAAVSDSLGNRLAGAQVNISHPSGDLLHSLSTDSSGLTPFVKLLEFSGNNPARTNNPFLFATSRQGYRQYLDSALISSAFTTQSIVLSPSGATRPASLASNLLVSLPSQNSVAEFDSAGQKVWGFEGRPALLSSPREAVALDNGNVLLTDSGNHRVLEITSSGETVWQYGVTGVAGSGFNQLSSPSSAVRSAEGTTLIADTQNNRLVEVDSANNIVWSLSTPKPLFAFRQAGRVLTGTSAALSGSGSVVREFNYTTAAQIWSFAVAGSPKAYFLSTGNVLLVDSPSSVSEVARVLPSSGNLIWSKAVAGIVDAFEKPDGRIAVASNSLFLLGLDRQTLSKVADLGASASSLKPGAGPFLQPIKPSTRTSLSYFVADTGSKRVLELDEKLENVLWVFSSNLETPSGVASADNGQRLFIADAGLKKVVGVHYPNASIFFQKPFSGIPVDVKWVSGDLILVTDTTAGVVQEINFSTGAVTWSFGATGGLGAGVLNAPRGAFPLPDGSVLIADTGNNRVIKVGRSGQFVELRPSGQALSQPSRAIQEGSGNIVVADTGRKRVIEFTPSGSVVRAFSTGLSAPGSVVALPDGRLLVSDQGKNIVEIISSSNSVLKSYSQLSSPSDAVVAFDASFYYSIYSTLLAEAEASAFSRKLAQTFSFILAAGSIGSVEAIGFDNSLWKPFGQVGGLQVASCSSGDLHCCDRSWCSHSALLDYSITVREKAFLVASSTSFRRGSDQPHSSFLPRSPFVFSAFAQLAEGANLSNLSDLSWQCLRADGNCVGPGVFVLRASTFNASNASNWSYSAEPLKLLASRAIDAGQARDVVLQGFVYSKGSDVLVSSTPNLLAGNQLAVQAISSSECSWPRVSCTAVRGACCRTDQAGSCTAFTYTFAPSQASLSPTGANCANIASTVRCNPSSFCGETEAVPSCTAVASTTLYKIVGGVVSRYSQDGLSASCAPVPAPIPSAPTADSLGRQLSQFVKPPVCVAGASGSCPATPLTAAGDNNLINSIRISTG